MYPDSMPSNYEELLINSGIPCAISPLHDKDLNADNTPKKAHYHVILCYEGPTTYNSVKAFIEQFNAPIPQPLEQLRGYYRYLTHKDNPEKFQYNDYEIKTYNGFDVHNYLDYTNSQIVLILSKITDFIEDNQITEYRDLIVLMKDNPSLCEYLSIAYQKTLFLNAYIKSFKYKFTKESWFSLFFLIY